MCKMKVIDYSGERFGRLYAIKRFVRGQRAFYECDCDCGNVVDVRGDSLTSGKTRSCGCLSVDTAISTHTTHGDSNSRLYTIYGHMKSRCYDEGNDRYHRYGARGIKICEEWLSDYKKFKDWSIKNGYSKELTIDRIDNDGDYSPSNCRWTDRVTQSNNTSRNHFVTHQGRTLTIAEWSRVLGVGYDFVSKRIRKGKSIKEVVADIKLISKEEDK